jgi:integrase
VKDVQTIRVPRRLAPDWLRPHEVGPVLAELSETQRPLFATALLAGLRKGELRALRKADVDLDARTLRVARSGQRDTTKGGHEDVIPIAAELLPFLKAAIEASLSELVFPGPGGRMMRDDVKLQAVLRRAMARAGIVLGYEHRCRKHGCTQRQKQPDNGPRRCPEHGVLLWPVPLVRPIRFHDLRHSTASNLMPAGVSVPVVQRVMRHRDPRLTMEVCGHLAPDYVLREIDKLKLGIAPKGAEERLLHPLLQASTGDSKASAEPTEIASTAEAFRRAGDGGRTRDPRLGKPMLYH